MKRIVKLDENAHWWIKEKVDWAVEDKNGHWWILRDKKVKPDIPKKRKGCMSSRLSWREYTFFMLFCALGVTLGFVVAKFINAL